METLVVFSHHRNEANAHVLLRPSQQFRNINCRSFASGDGILPTPPAPPLPVLPARPLPTRRAPPPMSKQEANTKSVPSTGNRVKKKAHSYDDLWAGPAFSKSPPPSSLPIPKFFFRVNRRREDKAVKIPFASKSLPVSPKKEISSEGDLTPNSQSATMNLRRILNLDVVD